MRTDFLGLSVSVLLQLAEERILLSQQHFDVLHAHCDDPGANVGLERVDTLMGGRERRDVREEERLGRYLTLSGG